MSTRVEPIGNHQLMAAFMMLGPTSGFQCCSWIQPGKWIERISARLGQVMQCVCNCSSGEFGSKSSLKMKTFRRTWAGSEIISFRIWKEKLSSFMLCCNNLGKINQVLPPVESKRDQDSCIWERRRPGFYSIKQLNPMLKVLVQLWLRILISVTASKL